MPVSVPTPGARPGEHETSPPDPMEEGQVLWWAERVCFCSPENLVGSRLWLRRVHASRIQGKTFEVKNGPKQKRRDQASPPPRQKDAGLVGNLQVFLSEGPLMEG